MDNLECYRGDDYTLELNFTDEDDVAIDITGATVFFTVKENESDDDDDAVISKTVTSHTDPTGGKTTVSVADTETDVLTPGTYYYDVQYKSAVGKIYTVTKGNFTVLEDITRRIT